VTLWDMVPRRLSGFHLKRVQAGRAYGISTIEDAVHVVDVFRLP